MMIYYIYIYIYLYMYMTIHAARRSAKMLYVYQGIRLNVEKDLYIIIIISLACDSESTNDHQIAPMIGVAKISSLSDGTE